LKKLKDDMVAGIGVQVYRVNDLSNQSNKFKVDMNAQQYMLSGCVVLHKDLNMVIVQGGGCGCVSHALLQDSTAYTLYIHAIGGRGLMSCSHKRKWDRLCGRFAGRWG